MLKVFNTDGMIFVLAIYNIHGYFIAHIEFVSMGLLK